VNGNYREDLSGTYELADSSTFAMILDHESTLTLAPLWCPHGHGTLGLDSADAARRYYAHVDSPGDVVNSFKKHGRLEEALPVQLYVSMPWTLGNAQTHQKTNRLIASGELPSFKIGKRRLIRTTDLVAFVDALAEGGAE
jgi:hypothetical protein